MLNQLTNVQVWVHDQDEALAFYTEKLGMELRDDVTVPELGNFRWLTVGPPGQEDFAVVLMAIPGAPVMDGSTYAVRLRDLEQHIDELKEQIRRSHTRLSLLSDTILNGGGAAKIGRASCRERVCELV